MAGSLNRVTGETVTQAAFLGDKLAIEILREAGRYLGIGLAVLMNVLNPEMIVLGGGVIHSAPAIFWQSMRRSLRKEAWPKAIEIAHSLRQNRIACEIDFEEKSFKAQFRRADKLGCTHAVILGENEVKEGKVQVKDMAKKTQMEIPFNTLVDHLKNGPATI